MTEDPRRVRTTRKTYLRAISSWGTWWTLQGKGTSFSRRNMCSPTTGGSSDEILTTGPLRPCLMWDRSGDGPTGPMEPRGPGCPGGPGIPGKPGLPFGPGEPAIKEHLVSPQPGGGRGLWLTVQVPLAAVSLCTLTFAF